MKKKGYRGALFELPGLGTFKREGKKKYYKSMEDFYKYDMHEALGAKVIEWDIKDLCLGSSEWANTPDRKGAR